VLVAILLMCLIVFQKNVLGEFQVVIIMKEPNAFLANQCMLTINFSKHVL